MEDRIDRIEKKIDYIIDRLDSLNANDTNKQILRPKQVCELLGISQPTLWRLEKKGKLPTKIKLSSGAVGFWAKDIYKMIEEQQIEE